MRIGIVGCAGRMGRTNIREVLETAGATLAGGTERPGHANLGQDLGVLAGGEPLGIVSTDDVEALFANADAVIEFSTPEATLANAAIAARHGCAHVIGTTGLDAAQTAQLRVHAGKAVIVWAPNMSQGVNLLLGLATQVARTLGVEFDVEILEMHHRHKVDAPSGTALALGRAVAAGRGVALDAVARRTRDGVTGARTAGEIGFAALRGGDVVGDHHVIFAGDGERIELVHKASDRRIYARGAVRAALWTAGQTPGLYGMADVLGLAGTQTVTLWTAFVLASVLTLAAAVPGPGTLSIVSAGIARGFAYAAAMAVGMTLGDLAFLALALAGLAVLAHTLGEFFVVVKLIGAAYLVWLGWRMWRASDRLQPVMPARDGRGLARAAGAGFTVALGNPKVIAFYMGLLPTLVDLEHLDHVDMVLIAMIVAATVGGVLTAYAAAAARARGFMARPGRLKFMNRSAGTAMIGAGVTIAAR